MLTDEEKCDPIYWEVTREVDKTHPLPQPWFVYSLFAFIGGNAVLVIASASVQFEGILALGLLSLGGGYWFWQDKKSAREAAITAGFRARKKRAESSIQDL